MSIFRKLFRNKEVNEIITDSEPQPESQQSPVLVYKAKMDVLSFSEKDRKKIAIKLDAEFRT